MDESKYIEKFNEGYLLAKHHPELAQSVLKSLEGKEDIMALGLRDGVNEFVIERDNKDKFMDMHQNYKVQGKGLAVDKERGKDKDNLVKE